MGYSTSSSATTSGWNQNTTKAVSANTTYYAITRSTSYYRVYFYENGATLSSDTHKTCYRYNGASSCYVTSPQITRTGYTIYGWNTSSSATTASAESGKTISIDGDKEYFAITSKTLTVNFKAGSNVTYIGASSGSCTVWNSNTTCGVATPSITPKNGYRSVGWSTANGATSGTSDGNYIYISSSGGTYYGNAVLNNGPLITISPNGYTDTNASFPTITITVTDRSGEGLIANESLYYGWSYSTTSSPQDYKEVAWPNVAGAKSKSINVSIMPPKDGNIYYLWVGTMRDLAGNTSEVFVSKAFINDDGESCFTAGTKIKTNIGTRTIENIKVGDMVYSYNEKNATSELKKVTKVFVRKSNELNYLKTNEDEIKVTPEHPLYVIGKGFISTKNIKVGDKIKTENGEETVISNIYKKFNSYINVYNFEVEDNHNYYVGTSALLAHNRCTYDGIITEENTRKAEKTTFKLSQNTNNVLKYLENFK